MICYKMVMYQFHLRNNNFLKHLNYLYNYCKGKHNLNTKVVYRNFLLKLLKKTVSLNNLFHKHHLLRYFCDMPTQKSIHKPLFLKKQNHIKMLISIDINLVYLDDKKSIEKLHFYYLLIMLCIVCFLNLKDHLPSHFRQKFWYHFQYYFSYIKD